MIMKNYGKINIDDRFNKLYNIFWMKYYIVIKVYMIEVNLLVWDIFILYSNWEKFIK